MNGKTFGWASGGFYLLALLGTQLFIVSVQLENPEWWQTVVLRAPFWAFAWILSVRLFGRREGSRHER
jgi:hypothetical protein